MAERKGWSPKMRIPSSGKGPNRPSSLTLSQWKQMPRGQNDLLHVTYGDPAGSMAHTATTLVQWAPQRKPGPWKVETVLKLFDSQATCFLAIC